MVRYVKEDTTVAFREIPDEVSLAVNISNCPHHCKGCHSPYLQKDVGDVLSERAVDRLIKENDGVTCFLFMGEGDDLDEIFRLGMYIQTEYNLKVGIYSGSKEIPEKFWEEFDYIKLGGYDEDAGPLTSSTTNQHLYKKESDWKTGENKWRDITNKFWR